MKTKILIPTEVEITVIRIDVPVDYDDEEMPNDFPGRTDDRWKVDVEIDTGRILNWPAGRTHNLHLTVRDGGTYTLLDATGKTIGERPDYYVPHGIVPGNFGDTIELEIGPDGVIKNWPKNPDGTEFFSAEQD